MVWIVPLSVSAGNAIYPADSADRMKSNTAASPGIRMQFRSPPSRNIVSEKPHDVSQFDFKGSRVLLLHQPYVIIVIITIPPSAPFYMSIFKLNFVPKYVSIFIFQSKFRGNFPKLSLWLLFPKFDSSTLSWIIIFQGNN